MLGIALVAGVFAACGDDDAGVLAPPAISGAAQAQNEDGLKAAAKAADEAIFSGDSETAYKAFSASCRAEHSYGDYVSSFAGAKLLYESFAGRKLADTVVTGVDVTDFKGDRGMVFIHIGAKNDPSLSLDSKDKTPHPWAYEDGRWVATDCSQMTFDTKSDPTPTR